MRPRASNERAATLPVRHSVPPLPRNPGRTRRRAAVDRPGPPERPHVRSSTPAAKLRSAPPVGQFRWPSEDDPDEDRAEPFSAPRDAGRENRPSRSGPRNRTDRSVAGQLVARRHNAPVRYWSTVPPRSGCRPGTAAGTDSAAFFRSSSAASWPGGSRRWRTGPTRDRRPRAPHRAEHVVEVTVAVLPVNLVHRDEPLIAIHVHSERRSGRRCQRRMGPPNTQLNVLRIKVATANDDHLFDPAGHVQILIAEKTKVARPHVFLVAIDRAARIEVGLRVVGPIPDPPPHWSPRTHISPTRSSADADVTPYPQWRFPVPAKVPHPTNPGPADRRRPAISSTRLSANAARLRVLIAGAMGRRCPSPISVASARP